MFALSNCPGKHTCAYIPEFLTGISIEYILKYGTFLVKGYIQLNLFDETRLLTNLHSHQWEDKVPTSPDSYQH